MLSIGLHFFHQKPGWFGWKKTLPDETVSGSVQSGQGQLEASLLTSKEYTSKEKNIHDADKPVRPTASNQLCVRNVAVFRAAANRKGQIHCQV